MAPSEHGASAGAAAPSEATVDLAGERVALAEARAAVAATLDRLSRVAGGGADALADEYIDAVVRGAVERMQQELTVFGRIDDDRPWRIGLYGIDRDGDQLVVDWRAPFATAFYRAAFDDPLGLARRVSYVGSIDDLFVEEFTTGEVAGSSPLLGELSRSRGPEMRTAVATLQAEQDELVRLPPDARLALRGGPGTGKTVVGLHRAAWLVYNDTRLTAGKILVVGPSDRFLRFVAAVLPALGEARIVQTTLERLLGPAAPVGDAEAWLAGLDRFEASLLRPEALRVDGLRIPEAAVAEAVERIGGRALPYRERRRVFTTSLATRYGTTAGAVSRAAARAWPSCTAAQALRRLRRPSVRAGLGLADLPVPGRDAPFDGGLADEVRARFEGVPATYGHVIVDEAQDLSPLQLRAVERRSRGLTMVGDDAQRSNPEGLGLAEAARRTGARAAVMDTAYRMSAEIAGWLNEHAERTGIDAVRLVGIRPTGVPVRGVTADDATVATHRAELAARWPNVAAIDAADPWSHKGVEYDAVVVDARGMSPAEVYLAASRAAHELVVAAPAP